MEKTLSLIKPDGVAQKVIGDVITRMENQGFEIIAMKMVHLTRTQAENFYDVHRGKPFFDELVDFMCSGKLIAMVLSGEDIITRYRTLMGATNFKEAAPGTIRHAHGTAMEKNVVHGSDAPETAASEISFLFSRLELCNS